MSVSKNGNWVSLGDYIELCDERNRDGKYTLEDIKGISTEKKFIATKANLDGVSLTAYKIVHPNEFTYVADTSRRGDKIALALNTMDKPVLISSIYTTFRSIDTTQLLPEYLYLLFSREEFDRFSRFNSWGSARETFDWSEFCRIQIPLPDIDTQQELVDTYNGLKALAEQNEALIKPLSDACQAYIVDCKKKYPEVKLGEYITQRREKNNNFDVPMRGVTRDGFIAPKQDGANTSLYNVFYKYDFVFNPARMELNSIYLNSEFDKAICSSLYEIFYVNKQDKLLPEFLNLFIKRSEFARFCWYDAIGSARNYFRVANMQDMQIPLPPIDVQQAIVNIYNCAEEAKKIAAEAREKMLTLCPALMQRAING